MKDIFEIRIHGRGGQGAKSASQFIVEAALEKGKQVQAFPEYGPERTGAPVVAYARISDKEIKSYAPVVKPDVVMVIDPTLTKLVNVTEGLDNNGILIVNTNKSPDEIKKELNFNGKVHTVTATKISIDFVGKNLPNTPMLGALIKVTGVIEIDDLKAKVKHKFLERLGEDRTNKTIKAVERGFNEVK